MFLGDRNPIIDCRNSLFSLNVSLNIAPLTETIRSCHFVISCESASRRRAAWSFTRSRDEPPPCRPKSRVIANRGLSARLSKDVEADLSLPYFGHGLIEKGEFGETGAEGNRGRISARPWPSTASPDWLYGGRDVLWPRNRRTTRKTTL